MLLLNTLPDTQNSQLATLDRPTQLTLQEFEQLPVTPEDLDRRQQIYALEEMLYAQSDSQNTQELEQAGIRPIHRFVNGLYHRELYIPPNQVIVGKRHAIEHMVMLIQGSCWCVTERGREYMTAPMTFTSPAGEKRVVITEPDSQGCTWVTLHPTQSQDLETIEQHVIMAEPVRQAYLDAQHSQAQAAAKEIKMNSETILVEVQP
jgi:hypothetical protein